MDGQAMQLDLQLPSREENRARAIAALDALGISYELFEHPAVYTIAAMDELDLTRGGQYAKNLFLRNASGKAHFLVIVQKDKHADLKALARAIGSSRLSFASPQRLARCLKVAQGSVSAACVINDTEHLVQVVVDQDLRGCPRFGMHPNDNTASVWLPFDQVERLFAAAGHTPLFVSID